MDSREMDALVQRLVQNPHDQDAIMYAHSAGHSDPRSYAMLLEKVGTATSDPALASHWLTEAANVWVASLNDAHRAARALMIAIDRDPTQPTPAERLADLYREKGDTKALAALLERRAKALGPLGQHDAGMAAHVASIHEELGRLWSEPPLSNLNKAIENYRRALDYDPASAFAIYAIREAMKQNDQLTECIPYFAMEQALVEDPSRKLALFQDEAEVRGNVGDYDGAVAALRQAREIDSTDPGLRQQLASLILERLRAGKPVDKQQRAEAAQLFVELAEDYPGEHAYAYATCALEAVPGHDRAIQLAMHYGRELGRESEVAPFAAAYVRSNPQGVMATDARRIAGNAKPYSADRPSDATEVMAAPIDQTLEAEPILDSPDSDEVERMLSRAQTLAAKNRKNDAAGVYMDVLKMDPANQDALGYLQPFLRQTRKYGQLRDVLFTAAAAQDRPLDARVGYLREAAGLCETQLRDYNAAIDAWNRIVALQPDDSGPREQLRRLLERASRWDDLALMLEREAEQSADLENRIALEKQLAKLHEVKRKDPVGAGEAWARIARATPEDDVALNTAVRFFEKAKRADLAAQVIFDNVASVDDKSAQVELYRKLAGLREQSAERDLAGDAYVEAARISKEDADWETAERCFVDIEAWNRAAEVVGERAQGAANDAQRAVLAATEADYLGRAGDSEGAIARLETATELDSANAEYASALEGRLTEAARFDDLAAFYLRRASTLPTTSERIELRRQAARIQLETLGNPDAARESLELVLEDGDDPEALALLADDAEERADHAAAADFLGRLLTQIEDPDQQKDVLLRRARLLASHLEDPVGAIELYERVLTDIDPKNEESFRALAEIHERQGDAEGVAEVLERHLKVVEDDDQKLELAGRLADLYETKLDEPEAALRSLNLVHAVDPDDLVATQRIADLAERLEDWPVVAEHMAALIEVEGEDEEVSRMTRRLAEILHEKLQRGEEALKALGEVADSGDSECREDFVRLGDQLGQKPLVAQKLVEWFRGAPPSPVRDDHLHSAFTRFLEHEMDREAATVAKDLARMRILRVEFAKPLEGIGVRLKDLDALGIAHEQLVQELSGSSRAEEMVRQAEVLASVDVSANEAITHGEQALTSVAPDEVEPLLERLAALTDDPVLKIDVYERQVARCKGPADRLRALARSAEIAAEHGSLDRARGFFDLALAGTVQSDTLSQLVDIARDADRAGGSSKLRRTLAEALAAGGQGARDGGRTRSAMLCRAAVLVAEELSDYDQSFQWLGDALVTHVDDAALDALDRLADEVGEPKREEAVLSRALEEVFDGPLVRKLLARRATVRAEKLSNKPGAAEDLKRLHDLAPSDLDVMVTLSALYTELEDYRGMVQLYEDQILRGRDPKTRAELARKVAKLWEQELDDPREAADAWRRVLRMKSGDAEAQQGLERAKANMLSRPKSEPRMAPPSAPEAASSEESSEDEVRAATDEEQSAVAGSTAHAEPGADATEEGEEPEGEQDAERAAEVTSSTRIADEEPPVVAAEVSPQALDEPPPVEESTGIYPNDFAALVEQRPTPISSLSPPVEPPAVAPAAEPADLEKALDVDEVDSLMLAEPLPPPGPARPSEPPRARTSHPPPLPGSASRPPPPPPPSGRGMGRTPPPPPPGGRRLAPPPPPSASRRPPPPSMGLGTPPPPPPSAVAAAGNGAAVRPAAGEEELEVVVDEDELLDE